MSRDDWLFDGGRRATAAERIYAMATELIVRDGFDTEVDELRRISRSGKQVIAEMEARERAETGIKNLKVGFSRTFGYFIEVSKSNLHAVPAHFIRKQTVAGGERYITPALKEYEEKVLGADERIVARELEVFESCASGLPPSRRVLDTARAVAAIDAGRGFRRNRDGVTTLSRTSTTATKLRPSTCVTRS
jgi:DNA mismatch repair protein MutS